MRMGGTGIERDSTGFHDDLMGIYMGFLWDLHGMYMGCPWIFSRVFFLRIFNGESMKLWGLNQQTWGLAV
jgi:hypothetical protein